jgi:uncharacterized protein (DUF952 family)
MCPGFFIADCTVLMHRGRMAAIYKILPETMWLEAQRSGMFHGSEVDLRDVYIHFSTAEQARETAAKHFAGQRNLVLLEVEADALGDALKWEPSRGGALFPHLYAPLDVKLVRRFDPLPLGDDGRHVFPRP